MSASRRLLTVLACAASTCALSAPAAIAANAAPSSGQGTILSAGGHGLRLVDRAHRVSAVRVSSARGLRRGDVVSVRGGRARVAAHVRKVAFLGRLVRRAGRGAVLHLGDGSTLKVGTAKPNGRRARSAGNVTVSFQGFAPGQTLLITIATDAKGNVAITVRAITSATDVGDVELHASGVITDDEGEGSFGIQTTAGDDLRFEDPEWLFEDADTVWCDIVDISYHKVGRRLIADELEVTDHSDEGDCVDEGWLEEVDGTITALAGDGSSLTLEPDDGSAPATYPVEDPSLLEGIEVGDEVAVTLDENGVAIDVEPLDWDGDPGDEGGDE